jgi:hypothetical protein
MNSYHNCSFYPVGSEAEGFRIIGSDIDHMIVLKDYVVVNNRTEISELSCAKSNKAVITMETQHPKPGYVRLILETGWYVRKCAVHSIITMTGGMYLAPNFGNTKCLQWEIMRFMARA